MRNVGTDNDPTGYEVMQWAAEIFGSQSSLGTRASRCASHGSARRPRTVPNL